MMLSQYASAAPRTERGQKAPATRPKAIPKKPKAEHTPKGVVAQFAEAQKFYNAGSYSEALLIYDRIIKKYPSHEPSVIQYAKTLYRLDRIPESYNLFARVNPQYLDPETSYEYGYSFYVNQRWDGALFSFKRVPQDHALYDLANYYGALSAVKLKKYAEAEEMLDKAVVLPDKLARSRQLYQKHVQSLRHLQEKADLEQASADERLRAANTQKGSSSSASKPTPPAGPAAYVHNGFLYIDRFAKMKLGQEHQSISMHGYSEKSYDTQVAALNLFHGPLVPLPIRSYGSNRSAVGLQLNIGVEDRTTQGRMERLIAYEDSRDIPRAQTTEEPSTHITTGSFSGAGWVEFALPSSWWTGMTASLGFDYPKFERGQRTSKRVVNPHLGRKFGLGPHQASIMGQYIFEQLTDSETEPLVNTSTGKLTSDIMFTSNTLATLELSTIHFDYQLPTMPGPDDTYSARFYVEQTFPLGILARLDGTFATQSNFIARGLPTFEVATADGSVLSGGGRLIVAPFSWLEFRAIYTASKTTWKVNEPERVDAFEKNVPDFVDYTILSGNLVFKF